VGEFALGRRLQPEAGLGAVGDCPDGVSLLGRPAASPPPNNGAVHSSGVSLRIDSSAAILRASVVLPTPGRPTVRCSVGLVRTDASSPWCARRCNYFAVDRRHERVRPLAVGSRPPCATAFGDV